MKLSVRALCGAAVAVLLMMAATEATKVGRSASEIGEETSMNDSNLRHRDRRLIWSSLQEHATNAYNYIGNSITNKVLGTDDLTDTSRSLLNKMDRLTKVLVANMPDMMIEANLAQPVNTDLETKKIDLGWKKSASTASESFVQQKWDKDEVVEKAVQVSKSLKVTIQESDDNFGDHEDFEKAVFTMSRNLYIFPLDDKLGDKRAFPPQEEVLTLTKELQFEQGQALPVSYNPNFSAISDESFSRFFFNGLGAVLLEKQTDGDKTTEEETFTPLSLFEYFSWTSSKEEDKVDDDVSLGPFVVDINLIHTKMRAGFRPLASRIHFSKDQKVTAIYDYYEEQTYKPGDPGWEAAKFAARSAAFTLVTVREHLVWSHLTLSNTLTRSKTLHLQPNHPVRRLLTVFTFRTTEVNLAAFETLVPKLGFLHRLTGYEYSSLVDLFEASHTNCNVYEPFPKRSINPDLKKLAENGKFPYWTEGVQYFEIVKDFVTEWIDDSKLNLSKDYNVKAFYKEIQDTSVGHQYKLPDFSKMALIDLLTQCIFTVTAYHELVGSVIDITLEPDRGAGRVVPGQTHADLQTFLITQVVSASTAQRMPQLMSPFNNLFGADGAPSYERKVWNGFQEKMIEQSRRVQKADSEREVKFKFFDPSRFECSISV